MRTATLSQLRSDIANLCDFAQGATTRYTPALLNRIINQSIQRFRERLSAEGTTHFLVSYSGTLLGPTSPFAFESIDISGISPGVVRTYGLDVTIQGIPRTLPFRPFEERNTYSETGFGYPIAWSQYQTYKLAVMPSVSGFVFTLWYLPVQADLVSDDDTFDGVAGWENWVVWDCVCQLAARDQYATAAQLYGQLRDGVWTDIMRSAPKVTEQGGMFVGRDKVRTVRNIDRLAAGPAIGSSGDSGGSGSGSLADILMLMGG